MEADLTGDGRKDFGNGNRGTDLGGLRDGEILAQDLRGLLTCGDDDFQVGQLTKERVKVGRFRYFQKLVGCIILEAAHAMPRC